MLVVEDDPTARAMLAAWLCSEGYRGEVATDARSAHEILAREDFDLILCDVHLPDADGPGFVAAVADRNHGVPVIFLTGEPTLETAMRSVQLRVVAYLTKPPNLDELRQLVRTAVTAHRRRRALASSRRQLLECDAQLARVGASLASPAGDSAEVEHLRGTVHQLSILVADLDNAIRALAARADERETRAQAEMVGSLRHTVEVLKRTRMNFKSKALGDLRKELESVLTRLERE